MPCAVVLHPPALSPVCAARWPAARVPHAMCQGCGACVAPRVKPRALAPQGLPGVGVARVAQAGGLGMAVLPSRPVCVGADARGVPSGGLAPVPAWAMARVACGWGPGVAVAARHGLVAVLAGVAGVSQGGSLPSHGPHAGVCPVPRGAQGAAGSAGRSPGGRGQAPRGQHGCPACIPWWWGGAVSRAVWACPRVLGVVWGGPAGARATAPVEASQAGSRGHSGAEQRTGADRAKGSRCCKPIGCGAAAHRGRWA